MTDAARENGFRIVKVGAPTLCATCVHGVIVAVRSVPHPEKIAEWIADHPEKDLDDAPFRICDETDSWCRSPKLCGVTGAFRVGRVLSCEAHEKRHEGY